MGRKTVGIIGNAMKTGPGSPGQRASERYISAVARIAGAVPLIIPGIPATQDIGHLIDILDGVILTGARPNVHPSLYGAEPSPAYEPYDEGRDAVAIPARLGELTTATVGKHDVVATPLSTSGTKTRGAKPARAR